MREGGEQISRHGVTKNEDVVAERMNENEREGENERRKDNVKE